MPRMRSATSWILALLTQARILAHARSLSAGASLHSFTSAMDTRLRMILRSAASSLTFLTEAAFAS